MQTGICCMRVGLHVAGLSWRLVLLVCAAAGAAMTISAAEAASAEAIRSMMYPR